MRLLVMGGTRFMGRAVVEQALAAGHHVTVQHRGTRMPPAQKDVCEVRGDRCDGEVLARLASGGYDAVIDLSAYTPQQSASLIRALPGLPRLVHVSSGAVYAPSLTYPWPEHAPLGPWPLWGPYAANKLACERVVSSASRSASVAVRLPYVLGPGNYLAREEFVLNRLLDDEPVVLPGEGEALVQFVAATDVGALLVALAEEQCDPGFVALNVASKEMVTLRSFVQLCAEVAGRTARLHSGAPDAVSPFDAATASFPFPNTPYVLDLERLHATQLPLPRRPLRQVLAASLDALLAEPDRRRWTRTAGEVAALAAAARSE